MSVSANIQAEEAVISHESAGPFKLSIFAKLEQAQSNHGIPHQDYSQYSNYCTAKISRLRHVKPVRSLLVHSQKYATETSSNGSKRRHGYAKRDETNPDTIPHENFFWNLFFQAERAWSQACALQQHQGTGFILNSNKKLKKNKHGHVQRRLNKAVKHATALAELVSRDNGQWCDDQTIKECQAYLGWVIGNAELEHKHYAAAFRSYKQCLVLLLDLANQFESNTHTSKHDSKQSLAFQDIWTNRAESTVRPLVRYCQYEAKSQLSPDEVQLPVTGGITEANNEPGAIILSFRGKDVCLDQDPSYRELAVLYLKMESSLKHPKSLLQETNTQGDSTAESHFLQLLSDLDDAITFAQAEYNHYGTFPPGPNVTSKLQELQAVLGYFRYQKQKVWRYQQEQRILLLERDDNDPDVMVHAYDALLQHAQSLADLLSNGDLTNAASAPFEGLSEDAFWLESQAHIVRIRAFRCFHLARLYESSPSLGGTTQHALALLGQAQRLNVRANEEMAAIDDDGDENVERYILELEELATKLKVMICRVKATRYLERNGHGGNVRQTNRPLWLRMDELDAGAGITNLVDDPPLPLPMPCKGTFYDIAWQHIGGHFPIDSIEKVVVENEQKKNVGFLGWLKGGS